MPLPFLAFLSVLRSSVRSRTALQLENLALRHQINVLRRSIRNRPRLSPGDRLFWVFLSRIWQDWRSTLVIVKPETVVAWHRKGFRLFWTWKVRHGQSGRPVVLRETRDLIRKICRQNPYWGAPRIHGELLKLGINIGETSVSKYMLRCRKPPSQTWNTFLANHVSQLVSVDFFTVPTIRFHVLYVVLVLAHDRRRSLHFNVTPHPTAEWTGQQLRNAFPYEQFPRYLLRDRDAIFGHDFREQVRTMGIEEVLSTPRSPWQRAYVERVIGSIRRECLDHVIVFDEGSLRRILASYVEYYHRSRTRLSLGKDSPDSRPVQPPEMGPVMAVRQVGGLHHRYERRPA
jgi:putative transposase